MVALSLSFQEKPDSSTAKWAPKNAQGNILFQKYTVWGFIIDKTHIPVLSHTSYVMLTVQSTAAYLSH